MKTTEVSRTHTLPPKLGTSDEITRDGEHDEPDEEDLDKSGEGRQGLADRIIERIRRALSPRSDGRQTDHEADDESETEAEKIEDIADKDRAQKKGSKRTKRMKKRSKDKKLKGKKRKKPKHTSKDGDDISDKIDYATEYPDDKIVVSTDAETDIDKPKIKEEQIAKVLATADAAPPPPPGISPPKSPEHITVELNTTGWYLFIFLSKDWIPILYCQHFGHIYKGHPIFVWHKMQSMFGGGKIWCSL